VQNYWEEGHGNLKKRREILIQIDTRELEQSHFLKCEKSGDAWNGNYAMEWLHFFITKLAGNVSRKLIELMLPPRRNSK
jgi:hypothetical protein